jgi:hypothetical protein
VVLDDKGAVKAERFGLDVVIDKVAETLRGGNRSSSWPSGRSLPSQRKQLVE